jgi:hypothetical protein
METTMMTLMTLMTLMMMMGDERHNIQLPAEVKGE